MGHKQQIKSYAYVSQEKKGKGQQNTKTEQQYKISWYYFYSKLILRDNINYIEEKCSNLIFFTLLQS